jgi:hypothetical protein
MKTRDCVVEQIRKSSAHMAIIVLHVIAIFEVGSL